MDCLTSIPLGDTRLQVHAMRPAISSFDHAFADGPVYPMCETIGAAQAAISSLNGNESAQAAEELVTISRRFADGSHTASKTLIGLNARLVNLSGPEHMVFDGPSAIRGILRLDRAGEITIGEYCYLGDNTVLSAHERIEIGAYTLLAHDVQIFDNDSHPINAHQREIQFRRMLGDKSRIAPLEIGSAPVRIGRRCWVGMGSLIMKGITLGDETIVAAGSVVTSSFPDGVLVGGNPARIIRQLEPHERCER